MTNFNLSTILKLTNDAFDLEGLTDFCFLHFRPVYDQFQEMDRKSTRVRMLIDHAERKGQLAELLALIQAENPGKYAQYANQLGPVPPPAGSHAQGQAGVTIAGDVHGDVVGGDRVGGDKVAGNKIEQHSVFNQSGQTIGTQYNVAGNLNIRSGSGRELPPVQQQMLLLIINSPKESSDSDQLAQTLNLDAADVKMHLDLLKRARLVHLIGVFGGSIVNLTATGRYKAQQLRDGQ